MMAKDKKIEIRAYRSPHAVTDRAKLASMIRSLRADGRSALPACWAQGGEDGKDYGDTDCIEGSHRLAAWERMQMRPIIALYNLEMQDAVAEKMGYEDAGDMFNNADLEDIVDAMNELCG